LPRGRISRITTKADRFDHRGVDGGEA
jgi:hypothetical protein